MTEVLAEQLESEDSMFVQTAEGIDSDGRNAKALAATHAAWGRSDGSGEGVSERSGRTCRHGR